MSVPTFSSLFARLSLLSSAPASFSATTVGTPSVIRSPATAITSTLLAPLFSRQWPQSRSFHATGAQEKSVVPAKGGQNTRKRGKGKNVTGPDPRIVTLKAAMPRKVPAPLRFARNRALRHWTIHRAWLLYQRKERDRQAHELERMYQSMHNACEELRNTSGPGTRDEGYLYRVAMEKHGAYGHNGIPIEYARPQTETPARQAWNHEWTR
ncbi:hypothetical protein F4861DRAFT_545721 [Xylaria intraflava]|nr:hypothetical protein F4861DRAFT_545721 [Xylaria intraflava]